MRIPAFEVEQPLYSYLHQHYESSFSKEEADIIEYTDHIFTLLCLRESASHPLALLSSK